MGWLQLGTVAEWVQAATGAGTLYEALRSRWEAQGNAWGKTVEDEAGLDEEGLRHRFEQNPTAAEVVGLAWEAAAETASDYKRYLLAQVALAALRGTTTPGQVDNLKYLLRAVIALDSPDITLLVTIGTADDDDRGPRPTEDFTVGEETYQRDAKVDMQEIRKRWPGPDALLNAALAALERQGLIEQRTTYLGGGVAGYALTPFGKMFLDWLLVDAGGWPPNGKLSVEGRTS